jgi:hypothetical protein
MNIYQKLIAVRKAVPYLEKVGSMDGGQQKFKYNPSSQVLGSVREALNEHGLMLIPSVTQARVVESYKGSQTMTELHMTYRIVNAEKPEEAIEIGWYGQGCDSGEKGVGKALTYGEKFLLLKLLNIPTDKDDPDRFDDKYYSTPAKAEEPAPRSTPAPAMKNVSRASVDALLVEINGCAGVTAHDIDAWRYRINGWPSEYVAEIGNAVKAAKARMK